MAKVIRRVEQLRRKYPTAIFIKGWDDFKEYAEANPESSTHILTINEYTGWLKVKGKEKYNSKKSYSTQTTTINHYLSTHTFDNFASNTKTLQKCGFNVILDNWDE